MKKYNPEAPLVFIHIPKAGGTSTREIVKDWFGQGFLPHYANKKKGILPLKYDLNSDLFGEKIIIYGHFNKRRKFGVNDYYPEINQFITILRDPYELFLSNFFYKNRNSLSFVNSDDLLKEAKNHTSYILNHFPDGVDEKNYKEFIERNFVYIGISERMENSMSNIANLLGFEYSKKVSHLNKTERPFEIPKEVKEVFEKNNTLVRSIYEYVLYTSN